MSRAKTITTTNDDNFDENNKRIVVTHFGYGDEWVEDYKWKLSAEIAFMHAQTELNNDDLFSFLLNGSTSLIFRMCMLE